MMGNTLAQTVQFLRDPNLVRTFQEFCGVQEVLMENTLYAIPESETDSENDEIGPSNSREESKSSRKDQSYRSSGDNVRFRQGHSRESSGDVPQFKRGHSRESSGDGPQFKRGHSRESSNDSNIAQWLRRKTKYRHRIKSSPSASPTHSRTSSLDSEIDPTLLEPLQVEVIVESYPFLDLYFRLATECGHEPFYITFIPFIFWNIDGFLAYKAIVLWSISMYVGQACKQLFQWKRPANPPSFRLQQDPNLETEYGFPSTHATVSTVMPFYFFYGTYGRYEYPFWFGLLLACIWTSSVSFSRIYLGVHSIMDIIGGIFVAIVILLITLPNMDSIDQLLRHSDYYIIYVAIFGVIFLVYIYPVNPDNWSPDRGDTAAIIASSAGIVVGYWYQGAFPGDLLPGPFVTELPSIHVISLSFVRFVVGVLILLPTRFVMKLICFKLLPVLMPTHGVKEVIHRPLVELPYKIVTYGVIGFNATCLVPIVFDICGISRG